MASFINTVTQTIKKLYKSILDRFLATIFTKKVKMLFLGLDNAGKTTLLFKIKEGTTKKSLPTYHANKAEVEIGKMKVSIIDLGGHKAARLAWDDFFFSCDGVLFLVDVADFGKFEDVKKAWIGVKEKNVPTAVLYNKIDKFNHNSITARSDLEFVDSMRENTGIEESEKVRIFYLSVVEEDPQNENSEIISVFSWMQSMIENKKEEL